MFVVAAFAALGLIVGSFLNVLVLRYGERSVLGRSVCMACGRQLAWYDMVPVISWLFLRGQCRQCHSKISIQYLLVEAATGILFATIGALPPPFGIFYQLLFCLITALLIAIAVYDFRHTIIPNAWVYTFDALALVSIFLVPPYPIPHTPYVLFAGPIAAAPLFVLWAISRGAWMGFGDVKLALGIGWLLGPLYGIIAVFFAFVIGAVVSLFVLLPLPHIMYALSRLGITSYAPPRAGFTMKSEIPFGPFLICSCFILWFLLLYGIEPLSIGLLPS